MNKELSFNNNTAGFGSNVHDRLRVTPSLVDLLFEAGFYIQRMGELADDMIEGLSCSWCGIYFEEAHGYPVVCETCWEPGCDIPKATNDEL